MFGDFFPKIVAVYETIWKNTALATYDNVTRSMRIAYWIPKATNTHSEYVILIASSTAKMVTRTRPNVTFTRTLVVLLRKIKQYLKNHKPAFLTKFRTTPCSLRYEY
jgi:hypothetical protein